MSVGTHYVPFSNDRPRTRRGLRVYTPAKVGRDAGEFVGAQPLGVRATDDIDQIVALDADCVLYNGLGSALVDISKPVDDLARLLESGKNVVSSALDAFCLSQGRTCHQTCHRGNGGSIAAGMRERFVDDIQHWHDTGFRH